MPLGSGREYTNSVLGFAPGQAQPYRYDKAHLVPFGEFVPSMFRWFTNLMNIPLGDFRSGGLAQPSFEWQGQRLAPNICYEDLFGDEIGANFRDEARAPTMLLNVSNIAWFGDTVAIDQHRAISRMRSSPTSTAGVYLAIASSLTLGVVTRPIHTRNDRCPMGVCGAVEPPPMLAPNLPFGRLR